MSAIFNDVWFHEMIEGQLNKQGDASPDALAVARAIMVAGAFVAEAIDEAGAKMAGELENMAAEIEGVRNACEELRGSIAGAGAYVGAAIYDLPVPVSCGAGHAERTDAAEGELRTAG